MNNPTFKRCVVAVFATLTLVFSARAADLDESLATPAVGSHQLRILTATLLELTLITTKDPAPARVTQWNFVAGNFQYALPAAAKFTVSTEENDAILVQSVGFRRRPIYAAMRKRDLRIGNYLYLQLATPIKDGQAVRVLNPDGTLWKDDTEFTARAIPDRYSPALHVNQQGYAPNFPKKAIVGYYLGTMGELEIPVENGFRLVKDASGEEVFQGSLTRREDTGFNFSPAPYQQVYEMDFSNFNTPGEYRLIVPGLGSSRPFRITEGVAAAFARTYALGLYHQRCGDSNKLPYTRHEHDACHTNLAEVPDMTFTAVNKELADFSADYTRYPRIIAPQLSNVVASLYPFVNKGKIDVSGGHHDAGDYSKYTINSAQLVHSLIFAVDNLPGVAKLDNLGLPESGDGISDLLQEAKWESDFLAKLQDADGGFYFLVYPRNRAYEDNVLPDRGDSQVVFPKNTAATAAAVAALAQTASSPLFKQAYPEAAAIYLSKALKGWDFLTNAFSRFGRDGAYQKISHYGNEFLHDDEVAWAATELFLATGDHAFESELISILPDPASTSAMRDGWIRLWEGYGCAMRSYSYGARSGRVSQSDLNADYLSKCNAQLIAGAEDRVRYSSHTAYGTSFADLDKHNRVASWFFSMDQSFDVLAAVPLLDRSAYLDTILRNLNYEGGCNPLNVSFLTGIGTKRQREIVHQYAMNDRRVLPPSGIPLGSAQKTFQDIPLYPAGELSNLTFPYDNGASAPYAPFDVWSDVFNVTTEFVNPQQGHCLAAAAYLMATTSFAEQPWVNASAKILFDRSSVPMGGMVQAGLTASGLDLGEAQIVWEARGLEPEISKSLSVVPEFVGRYWVEAEALLPDGRRIFAVDEFESTAGGLTIQVTEPADIRISGTAGQTFQLQGSNDLLIWAPLVTGTLSGTFYDFHDSEGEDQPVRFYRALLLQ